MNFNSVEFALFLPIVLLIYSAVFHHERLRDVFLLIASYIFYMAWYWHYAGLIAFSTAVDYLVGKRLSKEKDAHKRKILLIISMTINLGMLAVFKYFNFFMDVSSQAASQFGIDLTPFHHDLLLPVGISFYTFQSMSYTIDIYRRKIPHEPNLIKFATFISFFPQLVAGPIVRAADFLPQLNRTPVVTQERIYYGINLIFLGLFKKIVIADLLATLAIDAVFDNPGAYSSWDLLMALYAYAFQIYCDFSGYSDIAIGIAAILGYRLCINFNRPYLAQNVRDFWTRWHISLSSWLRDYLYISLGGNRGTKWFTTRNLMITMLLGGLWHGAAINFILWGGLHGILLIFSRQQGRNPQNQSRGIIIKNQIITFHLICLTWLLFRISDMETLSIYLTNLLDFSLGTQLHPLFYLILLIAIISHNIPRSVIEGVYQKRLSALPTGAQALVYSVVVIALFGLSVDAPSFIYFQF